MKPIAKEDSGQPEYDVPVYDGVDLKVINGMLHSPYTIYGVIIENCYYPNLFLSRYDRTFCKANNLIAIQEVPSFILDLMCIPISEITSC